MKNRSQKKDKQIFITIAIIVLLFILATDGQLLVRGQTVAPPPSSGKEETLAEKTRRLSEEIARGSKELERRRLEYKKRSEEVEEGPGFRSDHAFVIRTPKGKWSEKLFNVLHNNAVKILFDFSPDGNDVIVISESGKIMINKDNPLLTDEEKESILMEISFRSAQRNPNIIASIFCAMEGTRFPTLAPWCWIRGGTKERLFDEKDNVTLELEGVIGEELAHLLIHFALQNSTGIYWRRTHVPRWYNEGLANQYQSDKIKKIHQKTMADAIASNDLLPINIVLFKQPAPRGLFVSMLSYSTSYHFMQFLKSLGMKNPLDLLTKYYLYFYSKPGVTTKTRINYNEADWNEVIKKTFGGRGINNINDLEKAFHEWLKNKYRR